MRLSRRAMVAGLAAAAVIPARAAEPAGFGAAVDRAAGFDQIHALMIAHRGEVAVAERFRGPALETPVNVKSVSKSLNAAVLGAAIDRGVVAGIEATLGQVAPRLIPAGADPRVADITMADLVTMQAGLERTSGGNYGGWVSSRNWVANALARPFVTEPGARMLYSTGSFHILGAALAEAGGQSLLAMTREWIGRPLGIEVPAWTRDPQGFYLGGNEMALAPGAMIRLGEMIRQGGAYGGEEVLSAAWVAASLVPRTRSQFSGLAYGYGWFLGQMDGVRVALARGYGGQVIAVAPDRALTVAITSDPTRPARSAGYFGDLLRLLERDILPAGRIA